MKVENLRGFVAELQMKGGFEPYRDVITLDFGEKKRGSEGVCQLRFTFEDENDVFKSHETFCGCTSSKLREESNKVVVFDLGYNTNLLGNFTKQANLYTKGKRKQIIKLTGNII